MAKLSTGNTGVVVEGQDDATVFTANTVIVAETTNEAVLFTGNESIVAGHESEAALFTGLVMYVVDDIPVDSDGWGLQGQFAQGVSTREKPVSTGSYLQGKGRRRP